MQGANNCILRKTCHPSLPLPAFMIAVGKTKSLHIFCWELDAVSRFSRLFSLLPYVLVCF